MAKKVFAVYLAKEVVPNSEAYATLELPASPWELWDAMEKVRLKDGEALYMEIDDYYAFEYLAPHLEELDISLNELNDLAARLATLDEVQGIAFEGLFSMEVQKKVNTNGGIITMQDMRDLAVSAGSNNCCHVVAAANDAQLGRFYAANGFISKLDDISDDVFELLDFSKIGKKMRQAEKGIFVGDFYVLRDGELTAAPPCPKGLPPKPDYLFRLTLGLHTPGLHAQTDPSKYHGLHQSQAKPDLARHILRKLPSLLTGPGPAGPIAQEPCGPLGGIPPADQPQNQAE